MSGWGFAARVGGRVVALLDRWTEAQAFRRGLWLIRREFNNLIHEITRNRILLK
jgi:hypothetical protein